MAWRVHRWRQALALIQSLRVQLEMQRQLWRVSLMANQMPPLAVQWVLGALLSGGFRVVAVLLAWLALE